MYNSKKVDTYVATSVGSLISLLLICGYSPMEIFREIYTSQRFFDISRTSIWDVINKSGLIPMDNLTSQIEKLVKEKLKEIPTLKELQEKTGKILITVAVNLTDMEVEYFSPDTHPHLNALEAVTLSCALPLVFQKQFYKDKLYVDGGLGNGFPIRYIDDSVSKILGIVVSGQDPTLKETEFVGYIYRLVSFPINIITELCQIGVGDNVTLIKIKHIESQGVIPTPLHSSLPSETKMSMFLEGYSWAKFLDNLEYLKVNLQL